jgi:hypothetical protein
MLLRVYFRVDMSAPACVSTVSISNCCTYVGEVVRAQKNLEESIHEDKLLCTHTKWFTIKMLRAIYLLLLPVKNVTIDALAESFLVLALMAALLLLEQLGETGASNFKGPARTMALEELEAAASAKAGKPHCLPQASAVQLRVFSRSSDVKNQRYVLNGLQSSSVKDPLPEATSLSTRSKWWRSAGAPTSFSVANNLPCASGAVAGASALKKLSDRFITNLKNAELVSSSFTRGGTPSARLFRKQITPSTSSRRSVPAALHLDWFFTFAMAEVTFYQRVVGCLLEGWWFIEL